MQTFTEENKFKVKIPKKNIKNSGNFQIQVNATMLSYPIYISEITPKSTTWQRYILVDPSKQEFATGTLQERYEVVKGDLTITKTDKDTNEFLKNAKFNILDKDGNILKTDLTTNEYGTVQTIGLDPGTYYIAEILAPEGYQKMKEPVEFQIVYGENVRLNIKNSKIKNTENSKTEEVINIITDYEDKINNTEKYTKDIIINEKNNTTKEVTDSKINQKTEISNQTTKVNNSEIKDIETEEINNINKEISIKEKTDKQRATNAKVSYTVDENIEKEEIVNNNSGQKLNSINQINTTAKRILPKTGM